MSDILIENALNELDNILKTSPKELASTKESSSTKELDSTKEDEDSYIDKLLQLTEKGDTHDVEASTNEKEEDENKNEDEYSLDHLMKEKEPINIEKPTALVLSGGGINGITELGAIYYLYINGMLSNIKTYAGTSVGSMICYLLIIGYSPIEILSYLCSIDLKRDFGKLNMLTLMSKWGVYDFSIVEKHLIKLTLNKIRFIPTLKELYEMFNVDFYTVTYNKKLPRDNRIEYISWKTHPDLSCITSIRMSSNLPLVFAKCEVLNKECIDGGIADNFPVLFLDKLLAPKKDSFENLLSEKDPATTKEEKILGLRIVSSQTTEEKNILEYILSLVQIPLEIIDKLRISMCSKRVDVIELETVGVRTLDFDMTVKNKNEMFASGFRQIKAYDKSKKKQPI